ncbi:DUF2336 domain-containing protein [Actinoplanes sp. L3-i22]|uniref:DUF2336 domain-containing protein n=1 Tax=Actinoplanes sp. L3-i22 TaxID=2836373 RepID=UPI001C79233B|nr:DUF2336 domain-containing protein [Actinoplanes sp. L3-i22]BCY05126.1 hypothetical protein L3i22_002140 [Actinoplanes sp. L3-i22]
MDDLLVALAGNPALPPALVDRLIGRADDELALALAYRADLTSAQVRALAARDTGAAVVLARDGRLTADDLATPAGDAPIAPAGGAPTTPAGGGPIVAAESGSTVAGGAAIGAGGAQGVVDPTYVQLALLDEGRGRPEWARRLAAAPIPEVRQKVAACPGLPADVVELLAADPDPEVVAELALHTTDRELLERLARHRHADVRVMIAANPAAPPELLAALLRNDPPPTVCRVCEQEPVPFVHEPDCDRPDCSLLPGDACDGSHESAIHSLRCQAVDNSATPMSSLVRLAEEPSMILRWTLAARPDLPAEVAARLADDPIPGVRQYLAANPGLPVELIRRMADDAVNEVRWQLAHNPSLPLDLLDPLTARTRIGPTPLPRIEAATAEEIRRLAVSANPTVRMLLAARRDLPPDVRDALAGDPDAKVVAAVAGHPGLASELLARMVAAHGVRVKNNVAANPDAPGDLLLELARTEPRVPKALREIARHPNAGAEALEICLAAVGERARPIAAAHPALAPERVAELLADPDPQVAESAAGNPSLPVAEMTRLILGRGPEERP